MCVRQRTLRQLTAQLLAAGAAYYQAADITMSELTEANFYRILFQTQACNIPATQ